MERVFQIAAGHGMSLREAQAAGWAALAVECAPCGLTSYISIWKVMDMTRLGFVEEIAHRMRCRFCHAPPSAFYLVQPIVKQDPFKHMVFRVEEWLEGGRKPVQLISASMNAIIADVAYEETLKQYPKRPMVLSQGSRVICSNFDFEPPPGNVITLETKEAVPVVAAPKRRAAG